MKTYQVVMVTPELKGGLSSAKGVAIERQVQDLINKHVAAGWDYVGYETTHTLVSPGCLASLFGSKTAEIAQDVLIFSKGT